MATALPAGNTSLISRAIRAARLEQAVYEEVEADTTATTDAAIIVVVSALASAIGFAAANAAGAIPGAAPTGNFIGDLIGEVVGALVGWGVYAYAAFLIGTTVLKGAETQADWGQVARALGFASAPRTLLILGVVPFLVGIVSLVVGIWTLIATVIAVRSALDVSTGRAIAIALVSWLALVIVTGIISSLI